MDQKNEETFRKCKKAAALSFRLVGITMGLRDELSEACSDVMFAYDRELWRNRGPVVIATLVARAVSSMVEWVDAARTISVEHGDQEIRVKYLKQAYYDLYDETLTGGIWDDVSVED